MSGGYVGSTGLTDPLTEAVAEQASTVRELGKPSAAQIYKTLEEVRTLVVNLAERVDNLVNTITYDRAAIDSKDSAVLAVANTKAPLSHTHDGSAIVSGVIGVQVDTIGLIRGSTVVSTGALQGASVFNGSASVDITAGRVATWARISDGFTGTASSSKHKKLLVEGVGELDVDAIMAMSLRHYHFRAEVARRDDPTAPGYVGPSYNPPTELGMFAEDLDEAGLWQFVVYRAPTEMFQVENGDGELMFEEDGETPIMAERRTGPPVPVGIHYELWALALHAVLQRIWPEHRLMQDQLAEVREHLGLG